MPPFGGQVTIGGLWTTSNDPALEIDRDAGDKRDLYWRATTYDAFTTTGWTTTAPQTERSPGGARTCSPGRSTRSRRPPSARRRPSASSPRAPCSTSCSARADPLSVDRRHDAAPVRRGRLRPVDRGRTGRRTPSGVHPDRGRRPRRGDAEPAPGRRDELPARHHRPLPRHPEGRDGAGVDAALQRHHGHGEGRPDPDARSTSPRRSSTKLRSSQFRYETNVLRVCDTYSSIVECFAAEKQGFCEHYATHDGDPPPAGQRPVPARRGVPARRPRSGDGQGADPDRRRPCLGRGVLPGLRLADVRPDRSRHLADGPAARGKVVPIASPAPVPSFGRSSDDPADDINLRSRASGRGRRRLDERRLEPARPDHRVACVLLASVLLLAFLAWRRGPRSATSADAV